MKNFKTIETRTKAIVKMLIPGIRPSRVFLVSASGACLDGVINFGTSGAALTRSRLLDLARIGITDLKVCYDHDQLTMEENNILEISLESIFPLSEQTDDRLVSASVLKGFAV